jgi:glycosyltransferase involved in cell wall biosynthesis
MKFTVVTISFNQAEFLERTIQSVLAQKGVDFEYIIVDPGSSDGSRDIIENYRNAFAHVIYEKDEGPADGLNRGFALATGDIYYYVNSDDTLEPDAFRRVATYFKEHPEYDVLCGHAWVIDRSDTRLRRAWSEPVRRLSFAYGAAVQIQPSTFIRKNAFLKAGGFNSSNSSTWDGELMCDLLISGAKIAIIDAFLSNYRLHRISITNSGRLAANAKQRAQERFVKLVARPWRPRDRWIGIFLRVVKHVRSPRATLERIRKGPIFNRGVA